MSRGIYTRELEDVCARVSNNIVNDKTKELSFVSRGILEEVYGVSPEKVLVVYGEQLDPLTIKNSGKAFLSGIIENQLRSGGVDALSANFGLADDVFGSNAEVFLNLGLFEKNQVKKVGRQTYSFAKIPNEYPNGLIEIIRSDHPKRFLELEKYGISEEAIRESCKNLFLGEFNYDLRRRLEGNADFFRPDFLLSELEERVLLSKKSRDTFLPFSRRGRENSAEVAYVSLKLEEENDFDSGVRRCKINFNGDNVSVAGSHGNKVVFEGNFEDLILDSRRKAFSLDAWSRAAFLYSIASPGVYVTGGGSAYNEKLVDYWKRQGFVEPVLTHISSPEFSSRSGRLALDLPGKSKEINEVLKNSLDVGRTDDSVFDYFASWRAP